MLAGPWLLDQVVQTALSVTNYWHIILKHHLRCVFSSTQFSRQESLSGSFNFGCLRTIWSDICSCEDARWELDHLETVHCLTSEERERDGEESHSVDEDLELSIEVNATEELVCGVTGELCQYFRCNPSGWARKCPYSSKMTKLRMIKLNFTFEPLIIHAHSFF